MVNYMKSLFESFEQTFLFAMSRKVNSNGVFCVSLDLQHPIVKLSSKLFLSGFTLGIQFRMFFDVIPLGY